MEHETLMQRGFVSDSTVPILFVNQYWLWFMISDFMEPACRPYTGLLIPKSGHCVEYRWLSLCCRSQDSMRTIIIKYYSSCSIFVILCCCPFVKCAIYCGIPYFLFDSMSVFQSVSFNFSFHRYHFFPWSPGLLEIQMVEEDYLQWPNWSQSSQTKNDTSKS